MEEFRILFTHLNVSDGAPLFPIDIMKLQQTLIMKLDYFPEVKLCSNQRSDLLQLIKKDDNLVAVHRKLLEVR